MRNITAFINLVNNKLKHWPERGKCIGDCYRTLWKPEDGILIPTKFLPSLRTKEQKAREYTVIGKINNTKRS